MTKTLDRTKVLKVLINYRKVGLHLKYPLKRLGHKNSIKRKNRRLPHRFSNNPMYPLIKEFENDCVTKVFSSWNFKCIAYASHLECYRNVI